jgi:hypothetical protein
MSNLIKDLIKCGNKHCNHIATNKQISKLQKKYFKSLQKECFPMNNNNKKKCIKKQTKKAKHFKLFNKRTKCIKKHCKEKKILNNLF